MLTTQENGEGPNNDIEVSVTVKAVELKAQ
jgi:hypothetical protein